MKDNLKPSEVSNYRVLKIEGNIGLSASVFECCAFVDLKMGNLSPLRNTSI